MRISRTGLREGFVKLSSVLIVATIVLPSSVNALSGHDLSDILNQHTYFNALDTTSLKCAPGTGADIGPKSIYVLGDSLTVGMNSASLGTKLGEAGWTVTKINAVGGKDLRWGIDQVTNVDASTIGESDYALIGLGTNNIGDVINNAASGGTLKSGGKDQILSWSRQIITQLKAANPDIKIYWTNAFGKGTLTTSYGSFDLAAGYGVVNQALSELAAASEINGIIPWSTSSPAQLYVPNNDVHPNGHYAEMVTYIVDQLGTLAASPSTQSTTTNANCCATTTTPGGGTPASGTENSDKIWNFFIAGDKGLNNIQVAAILGNFQRESNFNPAAVNSIGATGIAQWLGGRKTNLIAFAADKGGTFDLDAQLAFAWAELQGSYNNSVLLPLRAATTIEVAVDVWTRHYEVPGHYDVEIPVRLGYANAALSKYGGGVVPTSPSCTGQSAPGASAVAADTTGTDGTWGWDLPGEGANPLKYYYSQTASSGLRHPEGYTDFYNAFPYGTTTTVGESGCGPVSIAMVVSNLTGNKVGGDVMAQWFADNGYQEATGGSYSGKFGQASAVTKFAAKWGVTSTAIGGSFEAAKVALKQGKFVVISVQDPSPLVTGSAHIIAMRGVTSDDKFLFADTSDNNTKSSRGAPIAPLGTSRTPLTSAQLGPLNTGMYVFQRSTQ